MIQSIHAYVLQSPHILDLMIEKLGKARALSISQNLQIFQAGEKEQPVEFNETLGYVFPDFFRADIQNEHTQRIYIQSQDKACIIQGDILSDTETQFDIYKDILLFRSRKILEEKLIGFGVDISVSSLGHFGDQLVYVVGAKYPDESVSQIWIDKQTFLPFRWITKSAQSHQNDTFEIRYLQWQKQSNIYYPMQIEFYQGNLLIRSIKVQDIRIDPRFPDHFFDISYLKSLHPFAAFEKSKPSPEESNDVQKTIENFKKIYE